MYDVRNMRPAGKGALGFILRDGATAFLDPGQKARLDLAQPDGAVTEGWKAQGFVSISEPIDDGDLSDEDRKKAAQGDKRMANRGQPIGNQTFGAEMTSEQLRAESDRLAALADQREGEEAEAAERGDEPEPLNNHPEMQRNPKPRRARAKG